MQTLAEDTCLVYMQNMRYYQAHDFLKLRSLFELEYGLCISIRQITDSTSPIRGAELSISSYIICVSVNYVSLRNCIHFSICVLY
ncbi:hypothetical protein BVRB_4g095760 [Beta vulgaris subsp. vulgaris]|uniref:Uncharacterized protein n=1 Tax=Beta vulgaris subsp. vulgaris TaxID=3555 RepID=A0A0J8BDR4_BETVV|nr:hypothetical protein BVRB_4g095760 [Beta vulgaris subsp. vulgaris]